MYCAHCGSYVAQVSYAPCASCGNPTNGAPPRPQAARANSAALIVVLVVVGGLVLMAIVGILAAIAIPNFVTAKSRAEQKRTLADLRSFVSALETYRIDNGAYPRAESMSELQPLLVPRYMHSFPSKDAWGNELRYRCMDESCKSYAITSSGSDRMFEHVTAAEYEKKATTNFDCDIVLVDGTFVQYPEGVEGGT